MLTQPVNHPHIILKILGAVDQAVGAGCVNKINGIQIKPFHKLEENMTKLLNLFG